MKITNVGAFPTRVATARKAAGLTQEQLAAQTDIPVRQIAVYENGDALPRHKSTNLLAVAMGVTLEWLATGAGDGPVIEPAPPTRASQRAVRVETPTGKLGMDQWNEIVETACNDAYHVFEDSDSTPTDVIEYMKVIFQNQYSPWRVVVGANQRTTEG